MMRYIIATMVFIVLFCFSAMAGTEENIILDARKQYEVKVVKFDATQEIGTTFPYSDYVRVKVTNKSKMILPCLTVKTSRYDSSGKVLGWSRAPSIPTYNLKPGESAEFDYYPKGHMPGVSKISVEVEKLINPDSLKFIKEVSGECEK